MHFRSIRSGALAVLFLWGGSAVAQGIGGNSVPVPESALPGVFGSQNNVQLAQASDPGLPALEEQIRKLNGTIEELNFQVLQMQEQMRKMQEDNEFRFQELENKKSEAGGKKSRSTAEAKKKPDGSSESTASVETIISSSEGGNEASPGEPEKTFGTITFDANGNVVGGAAGSPDTANSSGQQGETQVAALPATDDPDELYRNSYEFILSGDYSTAEAGFRDYVERFPADDKTSDAQYWLGESLLGQKKFREAAEVFLNANRDYPSSSKAPDMLLKLGVSLAGLNQRDVACATYDEVGRRYPSASKQLKQRLKQEQALAAC